MQYDYFMDSIGHPHLLYRRPLDGDRIEYWDDRLKQWVERSSAGGAMIQARDAKRRFPEAFKPKLASEIMRQATDKMNRAVAQRVEQILWESDPIVPTLQRKIQEQDAEITRLRRYNMAEVNKRVRLAKENARLEHENDSLKRQNQALRQNHDIATIQALQRDNEHLTRDAQNTRRELVSVREELYDLHQGTKFSAVQRLQREYDNARVSAQRLHEENSRLRADVTALRGFREEDMRTIEKRRQELADLEKENKQLRDEANTMTQKVWFFLAQLNKIRNITQEAP